MVPLADSLQQDPLETKELMTRVAGEVRAAFDARSYEELLLVHDQVSAVHASRSGQAADANANTNNNTNSAVDVKHMLYATHTLLTLRTAAPLCLIV